MDDGNDNIDAGTVSASDFSVSTGESVKGTSVSGDDITLTLDSDLATDAAPKVTLKSEGSISDTAGNSQGGSVQTSAATDQLKPEVSSIDTVDSGANGNSANNGKIDGVKVTYSEDISDGTVDTNDISVSSPSKSIGSANEGSNGVVTYGFSSEISNTSATPDVSFTKTEVEDAANSNNLASGQDATATDSAVPVLLTSDSNTVTSGDGNGNTDVMNLTYSEDVSGSSSTNTGDYTVEQNDGSTGIAVSSVTLHGSTIELGLDTSDSAQTTEKLKFSVGSSIVKDGNSNSASLLTDQAIEDGAKPVITDFQYEDSDGNGKIDRFKVSFSESLASSDFGAEDLNITDNGDFTGAEFGTSDDSASGPSTTVSLGTEATVKDTAEDSGNLAIETIDDNTFSLNDGNGNSYTTAEAQSQASFTDGAAPVDTGYFYRDTDNNGEVDQVAINYTETVALDEKETGDFGTSGLGSASIDGVSASGTEVQLTVSSTSTDTTNYGSAKVSYTEGANTADSIDDGSAGNIASDIISASVSDGAAPVIKDFKYEDSDTDGKIDQVVASFTETLGASNIGQDDLNVSTEGDFTGADFGTSNDGSSVSGTTSTTISFGTEATAMDTERNSGFMIETVSGNGFNLSDSNGNTYSTAEKQDHASFTDGANPVLKHAQIDSSASSSSVTKLDLEFTEDLSGTGSSNIGINKSDRRIDGGTTGYSGSTLNGKVEDTSDTDQVLQTGDYSAIDSLPSEVKADGDSAKLPSENNVEVNTFRKQLSKGWNYVSFPIADSTSPSLDSVLNMDKVENVWAYDSDGWASSSSGKLTEVEAGQGYLVNASSDHTIAPNVNNVVSDEGAQVSSPGEFELQAGWNLVGQYQEFNQNANADDDDQSAFKTVGSSNFDTVYRQTTSGSLGGISDIADGVENTDVKTGEAFWVQTTGKIPTGSLVYSEN